VCGQHHAPTTFTPGKDLVPIVQEAGWALEPVWIGAENLAPPGFNLQTFQPIASRYSDYTILAPTLVRDVIIIEDLCDMMLYYWVSSSVF
jgi:hypothetical protein